ncbi:hypothetical protein P7228_04520 [Altererythrobacter arenosus]|uniref:7-cyano-7-deazaguanine synthase n=1 Tax=Altererythrobacter arenosus TaxID=3032592 RepID=A0ABY8FWK1_9SPHN|nr:hypothetical protein [Altererythrobacter sp. CAU 1644]WFL78333.1 hypothetical protein P7228_04520 [Altererythrobacter sp. CAU 1644]
MRLDSTRIDRNYFGAFERHEARFRSKGGRALNFFFVVPHEYRHWLNERMDHWLVLGATSAAIFGENYAQDEPVSATLRRNVECLTRQWAAWYPRAKPVSIEAPTVDDEEGGASLVSRGQGLLFTGGVDSTFTLARRAEETDILIKAIFDWDDESHLVEQLRSEKRNVHGKDVLPIGTNVLRAFPEFADAWAYRTHGPALGAIAHIVSQGVDRVIFSSSRTYGTLVPWGSHPLTDPLLSSRDLKFEHYGAEFTRLEKIMRIAKHPEYISELDVCGLEPALKGNRVNCSRCKKCLRTMISLDTANVSPNRASTFDWSHYSLEAIRRTRLHHPNEYPVFHELLDDAIANGRDDLADAIRSAIHRSYIYYPLGAIESFLRRRFPSQIVNRPIFRHAKYTLFRLRERWT